MGSRFEVPAKRGHMESELSDLLRLLDYQATYFRVDFFPRTLTQPEARSPKRSRLISHRATFQLQRDFRINPPIKKMFFFVKSAFALDGLPAVLRLDEVHNQCAIFAPNGTYRAI
jgi:hypothetical protein